MTAPALIDRDEAAASSRTSVLSHSQVSRYLACPEQYRQHYVERLRARFPSASLAFGQVLHQALAGHFRDGSDAVQTFDEVWASVADLDLTYTKRDTWTKLRDSGRVLLARFVAEEAPRITNVTAVENRFELAVTGLDPPLVGYIDLVADLDGVKTVIDFKTASSAYGEHETLLSDQLSVYGLAEPEAQQAAFCVLVKTKEPRIEWHVTTRGPDQLTEYLAKAGHVAREIASSRFYKRPGMWCSWCDFLPCCLGDTQRVEATLIQVR